MGLSYPYLVLVFWKKYLSFSNSLNFSWICYNKMSEKFCLKWNDFHSNVSKSFSLLRNEDYLHDVTIVSDDNEQIAAHKLVLSTCSAYFKSIFMKSKHSNLLLCLEGLNTKDVRNMMDYMYNGELQIFQDDLDRFLNVAQRFKLEGLINDQDEEVNVKETELEHFNNKDTNLHNSFVNLNDKTKTKPERQDRAIAKASTDSNPVNISEIDVQIEQNIIKNLDGTYSCNMCGKNSGRNMGHCKNHIETHLEGLSFTCPLCEKTFRSRPSLAMHKSTKHRTFLK